MSWELESINPVSVTALKPSIKYRQALQTDVPAMASVRANEWATEEYWVQRISGYIQGKIHPRDALPPRMLYVAVEGQEIVGFIAGHLTERFNCEGELQWINVRSDYRGKSIASELLSLLAAWFVGNNAFSVCVDPDDDARSFYAKHGATHLNEHWMLWNDISILLKR